MFRCLSPKAAFFRRGTRREDRRRTLFMPPHELNDFLQSGAEAENSPNIFKVEQLLSAAEETKLIYTNTMIFGELQDAEKNTL